MFVWAAAERQAAGAGRLVDCKNVVWQLAAAGGVHPSRLSCTAREQEGKRLGIWGRGILL